MRSRSTHPNAAASGAQQVLEQLFREYGLPPAIRTDGGVPFATDRTARPVDPECVVMRLGIQHQRIQSASPQQFRALYDDERPHDALRGNTPSSRYPGHFEIREITAAGTFRFGEKLFFLNSLKHLPIGLEEIDDDV